MGLALPEADASTKVTDFQKALTQEVDVDASADDVWPRRAGLDEHALYQAWRHVDADDGRTLIALVGLKRLLRERFGLPRKATEFRQEQSLLTEGGALTRPGGFSGQAGSARPPCKELLDNYGQNRSMSLGKGDVKVT